MHGREGGEDTARPPCWPLHVSLFTYISYTLVPHCVTQQVTAPVAAMGHGRLRSRIVMLWQHTHAQHYTHGWWQKAAAASTRSITHTTLHSRLVAEGRRREYT